MLEKTDISVVIAAYNEEAVIANNLRRIAQELSRRPELEWEIICVNDGSKDRTGALMDGFAAEEPQARASYHRRKAWVGEPIVQTKANL